MTCIMGCLQAGFLFKFMAAQAPCLPLQPPIALAPADRIRLHDYALTARERRNACRALISRPGPAPPASLTSGPAAAASTSQGQMPPPQRPSRRSAESASGRGGQDALRRDMVVDGGQGRDGQSAERPSSASSMSGEFGRASSMGRALSNAAETLTMLSSTSCSPAAADSQT